MKTLHILRNLWKLLHYLDQATVRPVLLETNSCLIETFVH